MDVDDTARLLDVVASGAPRGGARAVMLPDVNVLVPAHERPLGAA